MTDIGLFVTHRVLMVVLGLLLSGTASLVSAQVGPVVPSTDARVTSPGKRLMELSAAIQDRQAQLRALTSNDGQDTATPANEQDAGKRIERLKNEISDLHHAFGQLVTGGVDTAVFEEAKTETFDWQEELVEISKPIFEELRALTKKPRQIEHLRRELATSAMQLQVTDRAFAASARVDVVSLDPPAAARVAEVTDEWVRRRTEIERAIEVAELKLGHLLDDKQSIWAWAKARALDFAGGRGRTLATSALAALVMWSLMYASRRLVERKISRSGRRHKSARLRFILYGHRLVTVVLVTATVVATFSIMGDFLLLTVAIVGLTLAFISARKVLPRFLAEARLLLGIGPVREGERLVVDGIPYEVSTINVYSVLRNPRLDGALRLPLQSLADLNSRPFHDELWFPTQQTDYVLLPNDGFAQVLKQTPEHVQLSVRGMTQTYRSTDFLSMGVKNLSEGETFLVATTFGIDYQHQEISLTEVEPKFLAALDSGMRAAPFGDDFVNVLVEFKEAGESSLDYLIAVTMRSTSATAYFAVSRKIQQICVEVCNRESWDIPFAQLTVHPGSEFGAAVPDAAQAA